MQSNHEAAKAVSVCMLRLLHSSMHLLSRTVCWSCWQWQVFTMHSPLLEGIFLLLRFAGMDRRIIWSPTRVLYASMLARTQGHWNCGPWKSQCLHQWLLWRCHFASVLVFVLASCWAYACQRCCHLLSLSKYLWCCCFSLTHMLCLTMLGSHVVFSSAACWSLWFLLVCFSFQTLVLLSFSKLREPDQQVMWSHPLKSCDLTHASHVSWPTQQATWTLHTLALCHQFFSQNSHVVSRKISRSIMKNVTLCYVGESLFRQS